LKAQLTPSESEEVMENVAAISSSETSSRLGRSVGAVLAGLVTVIVTHTGTDAILHALGVFPPAGQVMSGGLFALAATYRILFTVLGGYVTARLAPSRSLKHALVLGSIGSVLALAGMLATLGRGPEFGPLWYPLLLVVTALPTCWLGARIALPSK
jgi:hypothetical protein